MRPVKPENGRVANVASGTFQRFLTDEGEPGGEMLPASAAGTLPESMTSTKKKWRRPSGAQRLSKAVQWSEDKDEIKRMQVAS